MKKMFGVFVFGMLFISMLAGFVSAKGEAYAPIQDGIETGYKTIEPALVYILGAENSSATFFFAKILFLIIILMVVWLSLSKIDFLEENNWALWTVSIAVSLLAIRWIGGSKIIASIILPYSVLGIVLASAIPFVVFFLVVKNFSKTMRKISWIFFAIVFIGLWITRSGEAVTGDVAVGGFAWIYLATAGLALVFLLADKTIQRAIKKSAAEENRAVVVAKRRTQIIKQRYDLEESKMNNTVTASDYNTQDRALKPLEKKYDI